MTEVKELNSHRTLLQEVQTLSVVVEHSFTDVVLSDVELTPF